MSDEENDWLDQEPDATKDDQIDEYDLTSTPNDFNISTIFSFIESGAVRSPVFSDTTSGTRSARPNLSSH